MRGKIFISYRRDDSASLALGIYQFLERQFGRNNVFIDVDMQAGAKFPDLLERRLGECKILLALIGPRWLDARDDAGNRRLDDPNDWVRLEIARALKRGITVIPVRVEGANLPKKSTSPADIQRLLDNQAAVVTTAGFRNEMAGLAHDIRPISNHFLKLIWIAAAVSMLLLAMWLGIQFVEWRNHQKVQATLPPGSYVSSCNSCKFDGRYLSCNCRRSGGKWQRTTLDWGACGGTVENIQSVLTCYR